MPASVIHPAADKQWAAEQKKVGKWIFRRKSLYGTMLESTLVVIGLAIFFWINPPEPVQGSGLMGHIADILNYFLPEMFEGLITVAVLQYSWIFWTAILFLVIYVMVRNRARHQTVRVAERLRRLVMKAVNS
jgi:hypothetical protein